MCRFTLDGGGGGRLKKSWVLAGFTASLDKRGTFDGEVGSRMG